MNIYASILTPALISGQLIKIPFGLGGITLLDLAVAFILLINIHKFNLKSLPLFVKTGLLFVFICTLSLIFTPLHLSGNEYLNSFSYTIRFALYLLTGLVTFKNPIRILQISGVSLALLGLIQLIFLPDLLFLSFQGWDPHYFRAVSTFLDPNFLGAYLVLTLLTVVNKRILFAFLYIALLLTFSRSSYLMFLISFLTHSLLIKSKKLFIASLILFLGLVFGFWIYSQLITAPRSIDRQASATNRLDTWQQGLEVFQKAPFLGIGFNSYRYAIREYKLSSEQFLTFKGSTTNDFSLLYVAATTGIIGVAAYILFIFSILKTAWGRLHSQRNLAIIILSFLAGLLVHSLFNNSLFYPFILIWVIFISAKLSD